MKMPSNWRIKYLRIMFIIQSIKDDNALKDYITSLENRVTSLESRQDTLYKLLMATPAVIAVIGVIAAVLNYTH